MNFTSWLGILLLIGALVAADLEHATHGAASAKFRVDHEAKGEHNTHADHKTLLGSKKSADEFDDLPIDESKRHLGIIAKQMNKNKDGFVDSDELTDWIHASMISLDKEETEERFAEMDQDRDGFVTWDEYMFEAFGDEQTPLDQMNEDDRRLVEEDSHYFKAADRDGDGRISTEEFDHFQNPEHYSDMHRALVEMTMLEKDIKKDGKIDLNEFLGNISENSALEWYQVEKNHFEEKYDTDKNGIFEGDGVTKWLVPNLDETARQGWIRVSVNNILEQIAILRVSHASLTSKQQRLLPIRSIVPLAPYVRPFGMSKLAFVTMASLYIGGVMAKSGASFLEENEIFVPSNYDDD